MLPSPSQLDQLVFAVPSLSEAVAYIEDRLGQMLLTWELTDPSMPRAAGVLPFFIDWAADAHSAGVAPSQVRLVNLKARHPDPAAVQEQLRDLGLKLTLESVLFRACSRSFEPPRGGSQ